MKKLKVLLALLLAFAMVFTFVACAKDADTDDKGSDDKGSASQEDAKKPDEGKKEDGELTSDEKKEELKNTDEKPTEIQKGTSITVTIDSDPTNHFPWGNATKMDYCVFGNLVYAYKGDAQDIRGDLAESWTVSEDGLTYVFKIKEGVKYHNGEEVKAADFVYSWDTAKEFIGSYFAPLESYEATGEYELTVKLSAPWPEFMQKFSVNNTALVCPSALKEFGADNNEAAIGTGPYYIDEYVSGEYIVLKAFADFHDPDRYPSIETIKMVYIPDATTQLVTLLNGELDNMMTNSVELYHNIADSGMYDNIVAVTRRPSPVWVNPTNNELFKDINVRHALSLMIDYQAVCDLVYEGLNIPLSSIWTTGGKGWVDWSDTHYVDVAEAQQILEDAGYKLDDIKFEMMADPEFTDMEVAMQGQFEAAGIMNAKVQTYDQATALANLKASTWDIFPCHDGYNSNSPLTGFTMGFAPDCPQRLIFTNVVEPDAYEEQLAVYKAAQTAKNFDEMVENIEKLTSMIQDDYWCIGGIEQKSFLPFRNDIRGIVFNAYTATAIEWYWAWIEE